LDTNALRSSAIDDGMLRSDGFPTREEDAPSSPLGQSQPSFVDQSAPGRGRVGERRQLAPLFLAAPTPKPDAPGRRAAAIIAAVSSFMATRKAASDRSFVRPSLPASFSPGRANEDEDRRRGGCS
jgi:hypothetical protein